MDALFCTLFSAGFILHVLHNVWYQVEYFIEEHGDGEVSLKTLGDIGSELRAQDLKNIWLGCFINLRALFFSFNQFFCTKKKNPSLHRQRLP